MASIAVAFPVLPGKGEEMRSFARAVLGVRRAEFDASQQRHGAVGERWYYQQTPQGEIVIVCIDGKDPLASLGAFSASRDPFDLWFKQQVQGLCGVDLNEPPAGPPPAQIFDWIA